MSMLGKTNIKKIFSSLAGITLAGGLGFSGLAGASGFTVPDNCLELQAEVTRSGPVLLYSNSPEEVHDTGLFYRDTVTGPARVYFHHLNVTGHTLKLAVLMKNPGEKEAKVFWGSRGIGDPSRNYFKAAKESQQRYFSRYDEYRKEGTGGMESTLLVPGQQLEALSMLPGGRRTGLLAHPQELLTGMFDFTSTEPVEVTILICRTYEVPEVFAKSAVVLPLDKYEHRGTMENADLTYTLKTPVALEKGEVAGLAMGVYQDPWFITGTDRMTGQETLNYGNYGVVYHVLYEVKENSGVTMGINPWGGPFSGAGALVTEGEYRGMDYPSGRLAFGLDEPEDPREVDILTELPPSRKGHEGEFIWSPPGASNTPLRLVFFGGELLEETKRPKKLTDPVDTDEKLDAWLKDVRDRRQRALSGKDQG